ncbi:MAG TPA: hypothetical protein VKB36_13100, partial [Vicinamibacterales bacterium]|nr:hypothetical protein [Vicinamibacterales bacterium]
EPESPAFSPDGQTVAFSGLRKAVGDIFTVNLATKEIVNLTNDNFADFAPTYSPDGKYIIYNARVSGNQKLFRLDLDTKKKTQITFGTDDETDAKFVDDHTIVFASTATDPNLPPEPDVAKNGHIYNIWTLDLKNGEMRQYTDAVGGNWSTVVLNEGQTNRIAFVSYYKGDYTLHTLERKEPLHTAASSDFGSPSPNIIDFQPPLQHTLVTDNMRKKKMFEKMFLEGRPPVNVGVTSQGDVFGGTAVTFGDVLGDKQINFTAASIAQYRTFALSYVNIGQRFQYALQGYSQTIFYYGQLGGLFYDPSFAPFISHDQAQSTQTIRGGSVIGIYPLDRFNRIELSAGFMNIDQQFNDPNLQAISTAYQQAVTGQNLTTSGSMVPLSLAFVRETTVFREYGPLAGSTARIAYEYAPGVGGGLLSRRTFDVDARHYLR